MSLNTMSKSTRPLTHLGDMAIETFLNEYWQKKPILIRNALSHIPDLDPNDIAGFALEEDIESRILIETPANEELKSQWQLFLGPHDESVFEKLPETHWTLLVQAVDQLVPEVHDLLHQFRFIPNWRVDDIMVSYAADQGNVGPHFDYYDVFLLQAQGSRLWRLGQTCDAKSQLRQDTDCKILTHFNTTDEYLVNPGDLLYIPPQIAHWGVAQGECVTFSIGFRAPSHSEILLDFTQEMASYSSEDQRYSDHSLQLRENPGAILPEDIERVKKILLASVNDDKRLSQWFGRYMTGAKRESPFFEPEPENSQLKLAPNSRAAYIENLNSTSLFINGESYQCSLDLAKSICGYQNVVIEEYQEQDRMLIAELLDEGVII